jgi:hypothetical protein
LFGAKIPEIIITDVNKTGKRKRPTATGAKQKTAPVKEPPKEAKNVFKKSGDFWQVAYQSSTTTTIKNSKGMSYIHRLLERPDEPIAAMQFLVKNETVYAGSGKEQEVADRKTIDDCKERLSEIDTEQAEAEKNNDLAAQERLKGEREKILNLLKTDTFRGKSAKFSGDKERARKAVAKAITTALDNIKGHNTSLYQHLNNSIQCGTHLTYVPDKEIDWEL